MAKAGRKKAGKVAAKKQRPVKKVAAKAHAGKASLPVPVHAVVKFVKMLHDEKHGDQFLEAAEKSKAWMELHPSAVRLVRKYVADNNLQKPMTASVIDPIPGGKPYECPCVRT
jgi:hypothetical protein